MSRLLLVVVVLASLLACGHIRQVEGEPAPQNPPPGAPPPHDVGTVPRAASGPRTGHRSDAEKKQAAENAPPPLVTSAAGLLQPGAALRIQQKLADRDYLPKDARSGQLDSATQKALRDFQRDQGLPATGSPDDLTLKKLGLDVKDIVRPARPPD